MKLPTIAGVVGALVIVLLLSELRQDRRVLVEEIRRDMAAIAEKASKNALQLDTVTANQAAHSNLLRDMIAAVGGGRSDDDASPRPARARAGSRGDAAMQGRPVPPSTEGTARRADTTVHAGAPGAAPDAAAGNPDPDGSACDERRPDGMVEVHCSGPVAGVPATDPITREYTRNDPLGMKGSYVSESIQLTDGARRHLATLPPIPKMIHLCWAHDGILNATYSQLGLIEHGVGNLTKSNPGWTATVWDDAAMEAYLKRHIAPHDYALIKNAYVVEKTDLFRLLLMYHEGGIYQDLDRLYNRGPIESVIRASTRVHLPWWSDINFSQDIMMSSPGCLVFLNAIRFNLKIRRHLDEKMKRVGKSTANGKYRSRSELLELGPSAYTYAITYTLFGQRTLPSRPRLESPPHNVAAPVLRTAMEASPQLQTGNEFGGADECSTTFLYIETECRKTWSLKPRFLAPQNRGGWTEELEAISRTSSRS